VLLLDEVFQNGLLLFAHLAFVYKYFLHLSTVRCSCNQSNSKIFDLPLLLPTAWANNILTNYSSVGLNVPQ
jgi:hypothetical protein